jgi:hypothetical protein
MKRVTDLRHRLLSKGLWAASAFAGVMVVMPAQAQTSQQLQVYGYVTPRCWVANARTMQPDADGLIGAPRAICNQSAPNLVSHMRTLNADGTLTTKLIATNLPQGQLPQLSARAAMEIVVSPQI